MVKFRSVTAIVLCLLFLCSPVVLAKDIEYAPYKGYDYNSYDESETAPVGYTPEEKIYGSNMKPEKAVGALSAISYEAGSSEFPSFFMIENGRIIETDGSFNIKNIYSSFRNREGKKIDITGASDLSLDYEKGYIYIALPNDGSLLVVNKTGLSVKKISAGTDFKPYKVAVNDVGEVFAVNRNGNGYYTVSAEGDTVNFTAVAGASFTDICYSSLADTVFLLSSNGDIYDACAEGFITAGGNISSCAEFVYDSEEEGFIILSADGSVFKTDASGFYERIKAFKQDLADMAFNESDGRIAVLSRSSSFNLMLTDREFGYGYSVGSLSFKLDHPTDIYYDNEASVYILDSGNSRILKLNTALDCVKDIYGGFVSEDGEPIDITGAQGMYVSGDRCFIADTEHERVLVCNPYSEVMNVITKPEKLESTIEAPFRASKLIIDRNNELYVIADSINMGAFVFSEDYTFKSFYASNNVVATVDVILNYIRKKFLTREQLEATQSYTPISIRNLDIDSEGFLYTVTERTEASDIIRKLNYIDKNIINVNNKDIAFGDIEWDRQELDSKDTTFIDIDIDRYGFINVIDEARNKVFQYSPEAHLITVFGGDGTQIGLFKSPKAIESIGDGIFVLDEIDGSITRFSATPYITAMRMLSPDDMRKFVFPWHKKIASLAHSKGKYAVLHSCGNYSQIIDDVINDMKYDGRHSYQDTIIPVEDAYESLRGKIAVLGGMDVDFMASQTPQAIYKRASDMLEKTDKAGGYALGTGNSVPEYIPDENYFAMLKAAFDYR